MMTAADVKLAVLRHYGCAKDSFAPEWAALDEFSLGPGFTSSQRIDLFMVRAWSGQPKGHERHAIEIKVSRSDLRAELARPEKRAPYEAVAHRFRFATPKGLFRPGELPAGCGLLEVDESGNYCRLKVQDARRDAEPVPPGAFVEAFRRAGRSETRIRSADGGPEAVVRMEREVTSARDAELRAKDGKRVADERVAELLRVVGEEYVVLCRECRDPLMAKRRARSGIEWVHAEPAEWCRYAWPDVETATRRTEAARG